MKKDTTSQKISTRAKFNSLFKKYQNLKQKYFLQGRSSTFLENGFIYAPYIPLLVTPNFVDCDIVSMLKNEESK